MALRLTAAWTLLLAWHLAGCGQPAAQDSSGGSGGSAAGGAAANGAGVSGTAAKAPGAAAPAGHVAGPLKVALLTPGDINDQGWNQLAYEGLQAVERQLGAKTAHQVTKNDADHLPALRDFGDQGFDLVICHGFEYGEHVKTIAPKYPHTKFLVVGGNVEQAPNVATLVPRLEEATYLLGMTAGGMTKSQVIGAIGGMKLTVISSTFAAFEQGAHAVNPRVRVLTNYVGNFEDKDKAKEAAKGMIAQNADFLFHNADQAGKGMFNAAQEASGVLVFGSNRNQNALAPQVCLASAVIDLPRAFVQLVRSLQPGAAGNGGTGRGATGAVSFTPSFIELNMPNGDINVTWNDALKGKVPPALMQKISAAQARIKSGALKIKRQV